MDCSLVRN